MKTLKELKENCSLIAEFKNPAFIRKDSEDIYPYYGCIKSALYSNCKGKYYIYKCINKPEIKEYDNYEIAIDRYMAFIQIILNR